MSAVIDVVPSELASAAGVLGEDITVAVTAIVVSLRWALDPCAGMAGSDDTGSSWGACYDDAARAAVRCGEHLIDASYRVAALVEQTGINYSAADAAAVPGEAAATTRTRWARSRSAALGPVVSAVGAGMPEPGGWSGLSGAIGTLWPNGHQGLLRTAGQEWRFAAAAVRALTVDVERATEQVVFQTAPEVAGAKRVLDMVRAQVLAVADGFDGLADACEDYAHHVDEAHHAIIDEIRSFAAWTAGIEGAGWGLAVVSWGGSLLAAQAGEAAELVRAAAAIRAVILALRAAVAVGRVALAATLARLEAASAALRPVLERRVVIARLAHDERSGLQIVRTTGSAGSGTARATTPSGVLKRLDDTLATEGDVGPASVTWANPATLADHFARHGSACGAASAEDYARHAAVFLRRARRDGLPTRVDLADDTIRVYDPASNTLGVYRLDGRARSLFTPRTASRYWDHQAGELIP